MDKLIGGLVLLKGKEEVMKDWQKHIVDALSKGDHEGKRHSSEIRAKL